MFIWKVDIDDLRMDVFLEEDYDDGEGKRQLRPGRCYSPPRQRCRQRILWTSTGRGSRQEEPPGREC